MNAGPAGRRKLIANIVRAGGVGSQDDVSAKLAELGHEVTQATVSRDLEQLGAIKVKRGGAMTYALPEQIGDSDWAAARLRRLLGEWVHSIEAAGTLVVLKTPPGSAHLVGLAIDQAKLKEVAGTISGDDTIFAALRDGVVAETFAHRLRALSSHQPPEPS